MSTWRQDESRKSTQVAETILAQLGGRQFIAMCGIKNLIARPTSLQFTVGSGTKTGCNRVVVTLQDDDTYTVEFWLVTKHAALRLSAHCEVYCDMLQDLFERETGFYTTLFARS